LERKQVPRPEIYLSNSIHRRRGNRMGKRKKAMVFARPFLLTGTQPLRAI